MATTRIIPMHQNKGKSIRQTLSKRIGYIKNGEKTNDGELISCFACSPDTAEIQFEISKKKYFKNKRKKIKGDVLSYQVRQSFSPSDNVTPEMANQIGYELAEKITKGNHAFIVATHVDKAHVHNHIIWNSTTRDCKKKWRNFWNSYKAIQKISDILCLDNGLSIIELPKGKGKSYDSYTKKPPTYSDKIRTAIDESLAEKPADLEDFLKKMTKRGYIVKKGKHLAFKGKGQQKFIRLRSLGENYSQEAIQDVIDGKSNHVPKKPQPQKKDDKEDEYCLLINLQDEMIKQKGIGYKRWATRFNAKQMVKTMNYLERNQLQDYNVLCEKVKTMRGEYDSLGVDIKSLSQQLGENKELQKMIIQFARTKNTQIAYQKSGYSQAFKESNIADIQLHHAAKKFFTDKGIKKLPKMADLKQEYGEILAEKKKCQSRQYEINEEQKEILLVKANVETLLNLDEEKAKEQQQNQNQKKER